MKEDRTNEGSLIAIIVKEAAIFRGMGGHQKVSALN